MKCEQ